MDAQEFVDIIRAVVLEDGERAVHSMLIKPPGRQPDKKKLAMSEWYNKLNDGDKSMVLQIVREAVGTGVFGFLGVLDGVRSIEGEDKGALMLYYKKRDEEILLNDPNVNFLHDLL